MSRHAKGCQIDSEPNEIVLHHGAISPQSHHQMIFRTILSHLRPQQKLVLTKFSFQLLNKEMISGMTKVKKSQLVKIPCESADIYHTFLR